VDFVALHVALCCFLVLPQKRLRRTFAVLDLLLHERNRPTASEINEDHGQAVQGRKVQRRLAYAIELAENHATCSLTKQQAKKIIGEILERTTGEPLRNYEVRD
jgi:hypothetical protein